MARRSGLRVCATVALLAGLVGLSAQQKDPIKDYCRQFGHQTAVIDRKMYIDGGLANYGSLTDNPLNYTDTNLIYANLDVDNQGMPQPYSNLTKGSNVPSVHGGVLWPDTVNKLFYLYGGEYYQSSPSSFTLWFYDTIYDTWNSTQTDNYQILRASYGAGAVAQSRGTGYYYGGWLSNASVPSWGPQPLALSNLLIYDMIKNTWNNATGFDSVPRAEGVMLYLPISDAGMLVYFGGIQMPFTPGNNTWTGVSVLNCFSVIF